ncbi:MAG: DUF4214 domain-containing protein [Clostridia bacterium]|nr:DUF4214 domain-containing protein [Clostridia bacterium]
MKRLFGFAAAVVVVVCCFFATVCADTGDIPNKEEYFPDAEFRSYLKRYDVNKDDVFSKDERDNVKKISLSSSKVTDIQGIEYFENIKELNISNTNIEGIVDLTSNSDLDKVNCKGSSISGIQFSDYLPLSELDISDTKNYTIFETTNISGSIDNLICERSKLQRITDTNGVIVSVDADECKDLKRIRMTSAGSISLKDCTSLESLIIDTVIKSDLDINSCTGLKVLKIGEDEDNVYVTDRYSVKMSDLTTLTEVVFGDCIDPIPDIRKNKEINTLRIFNNPSVERLDLLEMSKLETVEFTGCGKLCMIRWPKDSAVKDIHLSGLALTEFDATIFPHLQELNFAMTRDIDLDMTNNKELSSLTLSNYSGKLDLSECKILNFLLLSACTLEDINLKELTNLKFVDIYWCSLEELDLAGCSQVTILSVGANEPDNIKVNLSDCIYMTEVLDMIDLKTGRFTDGVEYKYFDYFDYIVYSEPYLRSLKVPINAELITDTPSTPSTPSPTPEVSSKPSTTPDTPSPSSSQPGMSFSDFVERLYVVALGRQSEPEGKAFWCEHVGNGDLNGAQCANEFLLSKEFKDRNLSDEDFLKVLYKTFFDRDATADPDGFNFWMNSLKTQGRDTVVDCFINSTEWCNVCASYGVKSGATRAKATIASANATAFATRLYTECLGRDAEEEGLKFWSLGLTNQELSGTQAAKEFFYSAEFVNANYSNEEYINRMYKTFMGREPEAEGKAYWLDLLNKGTTRDEVFNFFSTCPEFTEICKSYAITR